MHPPLIGDSGRAVEAWATIAAVGRRGRNRPETTAAPEKAPRLRMGSEKPGSVVKGPPITVTCECGERHDLFYGESWTCPSCGRAYDTHNIPAHEYAQIRGLQRRYRVVPVALGLVVAALAILFTLTGNIVGVFFIMPVAIISWFVFIRPTHRRRYAAAIRDLPQWDLRAEADLTPAAGGDRTPNPGRPGTT